MQQYTVEQLTMMLTSNNLAAIHARLLLESRVSGTSLPSVESLSYAVSEQAERLAPAQFHNWLETLLDVPIDPREVYASELMSVRQLTGKSPAKVLTDMMRQQNPGEFVPGGFGLSLKTPWWVWLLIALAFIGAVASIGYAAKVINKLTD